MSPLHIAQEIVRLGKDATPGPWQARHYPECYPLVKMPGDEIQDITKPEDAEYIAAARQSPAVCEAYIKAADTLKALRDSAMAVQRELIQGHANVAAYDSHERTALRLVSEMIAQLELDMPEGAS